MTGQYLRRASLVVSTAAQDLDLSALHMKFQLKQQDLQTPNTASIRVYNLSERTANQIQKEFTKVTLQVGYEGGDFGVIFEGTIVQVRRGRESATDTYVDIFGADGDEALNFAVVNAAMDRGSTFTDRVKALQKAMEPRGVKAGYVAPLPEQKLPRGVSMFGMARDYMRDIAFSTDTKWSIQNGRLQVIHLDGYLPDEAVVLTSNTGMIGLPEQTNDGIRVRCLLNPRIKVGARVKIDNASVQQAALDLSVQGSARNAFLPRIADDGLYRVVVCEMSGDTRGQDWYSTLTCIAMQDAVTPALIAKGYT